MRVLDSCLAIDLDNEISHKIIMFYIISNENNELTSRIKYEPCSYSFLGREILENIKFSCLGSLWYDKEWRKNGEKWSKFI
jgi:hypothetical protein